MWIVHKMLAAFVVFSPTLSKKPGTCFLFFYLSYFSAQTSQMDILIGTFGTVSILCWDGRQVSGWPGWLVCSEAWLNQLAAWIARLILTGIHGNPLQFFFYTRFFLRIRSGITNKGERIPSPSLKHDFLFVLPVQFTLCQLTFWCLSIVRNKWLTLVVAVLQL